MRNSSQRLSLRLWTSFNQPWDQPHTFLRAFSALLSVCNSILPCSAVENESSLCTASSHMSRVTEAECVATSNHLVHQFPLNLTHQRRTNAMCTRNVLIAPMKEPLAPHTKSARQQEQCTKPSTKAPI
ncbi:hypothetical protein PILCRDRAFT_682437 [Piloderma croceum F 1598]|uniref:Uncharacterized protein n=1 Tax=Piloderma croceum (strain F 1598) TaxID=765440 RepID=A0A0C3F5S6_PILCF|nr:hypothetical protein PILCRDRAFT_682437 [Piloderma croceum F 1598]